MYTIISVVLVSVISGSRARRLQIVSDQSRIGSAKFQKTFELIDLSLDPVSAFSPSGQAVPSHRPTRSAVTLDTLYARTHALMTGGTIEQVNFAGRPKLQLQGKLQRAGSVDMRTTTIPASLRSILWFRGTDLRTHDNAALIAAVKNANRGGGPVVPVFCFDPRFIGTHARGRLTGAPKTGGYRLRFLHESVMDLAASLRKLGIPLRVEIGKPEKVLEPLVSADSTVFAQKEAASEEVAVEAAVRRMVKRKGATLKLAAPSTLYSYKEVAGLFGASFAKIPNGFTPFRNQVEEELQIPEPRPAPAADRLEADDSLPVPKPIPTLDELEKDMGALLEQHDERGVMLFQGGETAGLARLQYYVHDSKRVGKYFLTRNGMLGADYSTKFAPWLAHGCISPRMVHHEIAKFEQQHGASKSTYWVTFELLWRDFFRFFSEKHGTAIFRETGISTHSHGGRKPVWANNQDELFDRWAQGKTGMPLVDANMRELAATGFMSNRGRQNVASYLVNNLGVDWRKGAEHFENLLLDYDVYSNWGNWVAAAGLTGGRINKFNIAKQSKDYDKDGKYVRHWLPVLKDVPMDYVHEPFKMPRPLQQEVGCIIGECYPAPAPQIGRGSVSNSGGGKYIGKGPNAAKKGRGSDKRGNKGYRNR